MSYCKYHPLQAATYYCPQCRINNCDSCSDEGRQREQIQCFLCGNALQSLGSGQQAEPFWRHFEQSFRYPMNRNAAGLIIGVAVLSVMASFIPFGFVLVLLLNSIQIKYAFSCLKNTANGNMVPPDITTAYGGGLTLLLRLLLLLALAFTPVFGIGWLLGYKAASLFGILTITALPAIIILFAMNDNLAESLNPAAVLGLISAIGLPYGLLLAIIMIMIASVDVISSIIPPSLGLSALILQSLVSNYYTIVLFHIMGYMIFQYQDALGFTARADHGEAYQQRPEAEKILAYCQILVKEGEYEMALQQFANGLKQFPQNDALHSHRFELTLALVNKQQADSITALKETADAYLFFLFNNQQAHKLTGIYRRIIKAVPDYQSNNPDIRLALARACYQNGDNRSTVKLLNGLHKQHPAYCHLGSAYQLMAKALDEIPGMENQAQKARLLAQQLAQKTAALTEQPQTSNTATTTTEKAQFSADTKSEIAGNRGVQNMAKAADEEATDDKGSKDLPAIEFV